MGTFIDITGKRFGRLVVIQRLGSSPNKKILWLCQCDCGNLCIVPGGNLKSGNTSSCKCRRGFKHGYATHPLYDTWRKMHDRCINPNSPAFKYYGGRGIKVCERWNNFAAFLSDLGERPHGFTLERINNDGDYEPSNVKWASWTEQNNNKRYPPKRRAI